MQLGLYTFGDLPQAPPIDIPPAAASRGCRSGKACGPGRSLGFWRRRAPPCRLRDLLSAVVLGAIATVTHNIRLTTAVTVLSSADPVRVFEDFATVDLLSAGRAELTVGRGAFVESFPAVRSRAR